MKTFNALTISVIFLISLISAGTKAQTTYTASMGNQYVNEVFFSLSDGEVKVSPRNIWDIAFYSNAFSAGIVINDGAGVVLYTYPNAAISGWESFDTTGMASWNKMYNDAADFENGAFNRNALGHPDYGWGVYSMTTHNVVGDSIYLIKPLDGVYRKLQIIRKISTENKYVIRYANLDGSNDQTDTLNVTPYNDRQMMAFSFTTGIVDREPLAADWDLLFTRYNTLVQSTYYPVNGVLTKKGNTVAQAHPVTPDFTDYTDLDFFPEADVIGHDWKTINMTTFQWEITDSLAYFVQNAAGSVYKVVFEAFSGSGTGTSTFSVQKVATASASFDKIPVAKVYPNPASDVFKLELNESLNGAVAGLYDLSGRLVREQLLDNSLLHEFQISGIDPGTYVLKINDKARNSAFKVVVK
ncbi:MAG: hypothetical protein FD170_3327 [Bacteroidetes bacterium]|nr:MAG: hypothetical protein FD170_3327 [Bacteroidota bacterium]